MKTSKGRRLVFERIRNGDGSASETFGDYLLDGRLSLVTAMPLLDELRDYLLKNSILLADVGLTNILVRELPGRRVLYLVDGLGSRKLGFKFAIRRRVPFLSRSRTKDKWHLLLTGIGNFVTLNGLASGLPEEMAGS